MLIYMVLYKCHKCKKEYLKKSHYIQHINRKKPCIQLNLKESEGIQQNNEEKVNAPTNNITQEKVNNRCNYCYKIFSTNSNFNRHMRLNCKVKQENENEKEVILKEILVELKELKDKNKILEENNKNLEKKISKINKHSKLINSNNNIQNSNNNIQNTENNNTMNNFITINAYGKEDLSHISNKTWQSIMNKCFDSVPQLVGHVHYDDDKPENHNVYISNIKSNYAVTYNGNNWILQEKSKILDDLYTTKIELLEDKLVELDDKLDDSAKRSLKKFLDRQEENDIENMIKEKIKLRLYNNKRKPLKARKIMSE